MRKHRVFFKLDELEFATFPILKQVQEGLGKRGKSR